MKFFKHALFMLLCLCSMAWSGEDETCLRSNPPEPLRASATLLLVERDQLPQMDVALDIPLDRSSLSEKRRAFNDDQLFNYPEINRLRLISSPENMFVFDLYFYGEMAQMIAIKNLDWRLFYHTRLPKSGTSRMNGIRKLHAHFSEYERRNIFFQRAPRRVDVSATARELAHRLKNKKYDILPLEIFTITNNCRSLVSYEYEWPGFFKGYFQLPVEFADRLLAAYDQIYDCKEDRWLGLDHSQSHTEIRFSKFYQDHYNQSFHSWRPRDVLVNLWSKFFEDNYRWHALGDFDRIAIPIDDLKNEWPLPHASEVKTLEKPLSQAKGAIDFLEFTWETQVKSGYMRMLEAYSYTRTFCSSGDEQTPPPDFEVPEYWVEMEQKKFWLEKKCLIVPHTFKNWEDLLIYPVYLSAFEVDGVYTGRSWNHAFRDLGDFNNKLFKNEKARMPFGFTDFVSRYNTAKLNLSQKYLSIELPDTNGNSFILANVPWELLKKEHQGERLETKFKRDFGNYHLVRGVERILGIETRPLANFDRDVEPSTLEGRDPMYAFFYDERTRLIKNHHLPKIGIEQWILRWRKPDKLVLDFIAHERIMPVARFEIDCQECERYLAD